MLCFSWLGTHQILQNKNFDKNKIKYYKLYIYTPRQNRIGIFPSLCSSSFQSTNLSGQAVF